MDSYSYIVCVLCVCVCLQSQNSQGMKPLLGCSAAAKHIQVPYIHSTKLMYK